MRESESGRAANIDSSPVQVPPLADTVPCPRHTRVHVCVCIRTLALALRLYIFRSTFAVFKPLLLLLSFREHRIERRQTSITIRNVLAPYAGWNEWIRVLSTFGFLVEASLSLRTSVGLVFFCAQNDFPTFSPVTKFNRFGRVRVNSPFRASKFLAYTNVRECLLARLLVLKKNL